MTHPDEQPREVTSTDLWDAADRITQRQRRRLTRDNGTSEHVTLPSLWEQLVEAIDSGTGTHTRGVQRSKAPCDDSALSLTITIATTVRDACLDHGLKRTRDTPRDLRAVVSRTAGRLDQDAMRALHEQLRSWAGRIRATISNDPDRTWRMHGAPCRVCQSRTVPVFDDEGTETRVPALVVHSEDGVIELVACDFCGSKLTGPDLTAILLDTLKQPAGARMSA